MLKKMEGVVIRTQDYGETHKIITIFTKDLGKLSAIARGANKPKSRLNATSQLLVRSEFLIYVSKGLSTIQQGDIITSYRNIQSDIEKTAYAALIVELTNQLLEMKKPDYFLYDQLIQTLDWISTSDDYMIPVMMFEMKMYAKGGFAPVVDHCVNCGQTSSSYDFSIQDGGIICQRCKPANIATIQLPPSLVKVLQIFLHVSLDRVGKINIRKENEQLLRNILDAYYDAYGGYPLKAKRFINQLNNLKK